MKTVLLFAAAVSTASASAGYAEKFEEFKATYQKEYEDADEELRRFKIFVHNVDAAEKMQALDPDAKYGHLSPLADMSEMEYGNRNNLPVTREHLEEHASKAVTLSTEMHTLPDSFDWREKGAVVEVKNQGQCGSCWSFATVASIEGANYVKNGQLLSLSEQELVDCDGDDDGCDGGLPINAYKDLIDNRLGLELEKDYPYSATDGHKCHAKPSSEKVFISSWVRVKTDEDQIAMALMKYGPLAIGINATPMQMYMGGISDPWFCNPAALDHGVTIVAFGKESKPFWVIKNSWGAGWGEKGYYRIVRGKGACGLNRMVATAIAAPSATSKSQIYI